MATAEQRNHAKAFPKKAQEYLASAEDNLAAGRYTPAAGDAIHAGVGAKDAIVTVLTGATRKAKDHAAAAKELEQALGESRCRRSPPTHTRPELWCSSAHPRSRRRAAKGSLSSVRLANGRLGTVEGPTTTGRTQPDLGSITAPPTRHWGSVITCSVKVSG